MHRTLLAALAAGHWPKDHKITRSQATAFGCRRSAIPAHPQVHRLTAPSVQDVQIHCLTLTKPHIVLVDSADAEVLGPVADKLAQAGVGKVYSWNPVSHLNAGAQKAVKVGSRAKVMLFADSTTVPRLCQPARFAPVCGGCEARRWLQWRRRARERWADSLHFGVSTDEWGGTVPRICC